MKMTGYLVALAMAICTTGMSQSKTVSEEYWVVETHCRDTIYSVVRFFNGSDMLLHEVRIENVAIDIQQKRQRRKLDQLLAEYKMRAMSGAKKIRGRASV
jgi:hypothetical protein